jgi:hypothetical protein
VASARDAVDETVDRLTPSASAISPSRARSGILDDVFGRLLVTEQQQPDPDELDGMGAV